MTATEREFYEGTTQKKKTYRAKWGKVKLDKNKPRTTSVLGDQYQKSDNKLKETSNDILPGRPTVELPNLWDPRPYQIPAWRALENGARRSVLLWHRRAGKDSVALAWTTVASQLRVGLYWHVFPTYNQGKKAIWKGMTKEGRPFLDMWPPQLIKRGPIEDEMRIELKNGSIWQVVGTDNIDRLVGSNPIGVVFSEYALQDPRAWDLIRPILNENGGWAIFPYTPRGKNQGFDLFTRAHDLMKKDPKRWFAQRLTVDDTKAIPLSVIEEDRQSGMAARPQSDKSTGVTSTRRWWAATTAIRYATPSVRGVSGSCPGCLTFLSTPGGISARATRQLCGSCNVSPTGGWTSSTSTRPTARVSSTTRSFSRKSRTATASTTGLMTWRKPSGAPGRKLLRQLRVSAYVSPSRQNSRY